MPTMITLPNGRTVQTVAMPAVPGFRTVEWSHEDAGAETVSPFTGETQVLQWPGADLLRGTLTLPNMTTAQYNEWRGFLAGCRGKALGFMLADPINTVPAGNIGGSTPLVDNSAAGANVAATQLLFSKGWDANAQGVLLPGDALQLGYRLHYVTEQVDADSGGLAQIGIWPSLREMPVDCSAITLGDAAGLFRRADNTFTSSVTIGQIHSLSFRVQEYR